MLTIDQQRMLEYINHHSNCWEKVPPAKDGRLKWFVTMGYATFDDGYRITPAGRDALANGEREV